MIAPKPHSKFVNPSPRRLPRCRKVTVAAGYVCDEGVILCADTQETIPGYTKTDANKLLAFNTGPGNNAVFAGAGNNAVQIDEAAYSIARKIQEDWPIKDKRLHQSMKECLEELFPRHSYPRAEVEVQLLMAVQSDAGAALFRIADCNFSPVTKNACIGTGVILGNQLLQRHYDNSVLLSDAAVIAIYTLHHVKRWVDGCGGNTDIALVPHHGGKISYMPSTDVDKIEKYCDAYDDALKNLLVQIPRTPKNLKAFDQYIQIAKNQLSMARLAFQDYEDSMREIAAQLGMSYEQFMNAPKAEDFFEYPKRSASHSSEDQP
jgi:20S proteasome alpha/beta subunit